MCSVPVGLGECERHLTRAHVPDRAAAVLARRGQARAARAPCAAHAGVAEAAQLAERGVPCTPQRVGCGTTLAARLLRTGASHAGARSMVSWQALRDAAHFVRPFLPASRHNKSRRLAPPHPWQAPGMLTATWHVCRAGASDTWAEGRVCGLDWPRKRACGGGAVQVHGGRAPVGRVADAGEQAAAGRERAVVARRRRGDARQRPHGRQRKHAHRLVVVAHVQPQLVCARPARRRRQGHTNQIRALCMRTTVNAVVGRHRVGQTIISY